MEEYEDKMIAQIDGKLFDVFWSTYGKKINLNKDFIKKVFLTLKFHILTFKFFLFLERFEWK